MLMIFSDDSAFGEVFESPLVSSLLHEHQLLSIPLVQVGGFDERVHDTILAMLARAVDAEVHAQVDGGPGGILLLAVDADVIFVYFFQLLEY